MASTHTMTLPQDGSSADSQYLSASLSSLSRSRSAHSHLVRTYKQATQLYLTKRFVDALETLEPLITPSSSADDGPTSFDSQETLRPGTTTTSTRAPVAQSSRSTRIKVWVFYLSLLHAIIELGPEEGKLVFGSTRWRELAGKVRDGTIWEEVVRAGYGGQEGEVDADVVANLATLLLGHMATQTLNQQRVESWLAASSGGGGGDADSLASFPVDGGTMTPNSQAASSPKALATRLKILELYTLHVLPANGEWGYAREFIEMNDMMDEDRREAFLQALQSLKEEQDGTALRERELAARRDREMEEQRRRDAARQEEQARQDEDQRRKAEEAAQRRKAPTQAAHFKPDVPPSIPRPSSNKASTPNGHHVKPASRPASRPTRKPQIPSPSSSANPSSTNLYHRASAVLRNMHQILLQASRSMACNPLTLLRTLMFALAFLMIVARRDLRMKIRRAMEEGWVKVKRTVGMGVKVSYI